MFHVFKGNISTVLDGEDAKVKKRSLVLLCMLEALPWCSRGPKWGEQIGNKRKVKFINLSV